MNVFSTVVVGGITVWVILAYVLTSFLDLPKSKLLAVRMIIMFLGVAIGSAIAWYKKRGRAATAAITGTATGAADAEAGIEGVLREASVRLATSSLGSDAKLSRLPVILITGPAGAAKTTAVLESGLEPELLAGQVNQEGSTIPTAIGNAWLAQKAAIIEVGSALQGDSKTWQLLSAYIQAGKLKSAFSRADAAPRAVVVCYDCENFLKSGATDSAGEAAKAIRTQLYQLSAMLGRNLPVYVLFTKLDRVAFFFEYSRNLEKQEATEILGATLPVLESSTGVYGERETARLGEVFNELAFRLGDKRTELLTRESDPAVTWSAYEFPREFRKMRGPAVKFLLELCRPSQLNVGPFLRGFYFSGVRPVMMEEEVAAPVGRPAAARRDTGNADATGIFSAQRSAVPLEGATPYRTSKRRVPQWVFLPRVFREVILSDRNGLAVSSASVKTNSLRRLLLIAAICLSLGFVLLATISYSKNRALIAEVKQAANAVAADNAGAAAVPLDSLQKLDALRLALVQLTGYQRSGAPMSFKWGLYTGSDLLPDARRLYFDRFKSLLFGGIQDGFVSTMRSWPASPPPAADYGYSYDTLKAYLETTSNHEKATLAYLPPLLQARWTANQAIEAQKTLLARRQFDFYTSELTVDNPYSTGADAAAVDKGRRYLAQFAGVARVYQAMLTEANQSSKPVIFNQRFPGSSEVVINTREVQGAFTKPGFAFMENAIKNPGKYVSGERWVLGDQGSAVTDSPNLAQQIRALYYADLIGNWRDYLKRSVVVRYANLPDAAKKLTLTSSPQSPLLALFWLASQNTDVNASPVQQAFKPLHALMPPANVDQYVGPANTNYMTGLTALQSSLDQAAKMPPEQNQAAADQTSAAASAARLTTRQTALTLGLDPEAHIEATIEKLLEDPITNAEAVKPNGPSPAPLNGSGADFCSKFRVLTAKFPFDPNSKSQASVDEINSIFRPQQGSLWQFYDQKLSKLLAKQGSAYAPVPGGKPELTSRFLAFFNNAARFSNSVYSNGASQDPKLTFSLQPAFSADIQNVALTVNGQTGNFKPNSSAQQFSWPGAGTGIRLTVKSGSDFIYPNYDGLWGVFEFFNDADKPLPSPEWMLKSGRSDKPVTSPLNNQPIIVHFNVDMLGNPPVFQKGYFRELACVSEVAK